MSAQRQTRERGDICRQRIGEESFHARRLAIGGLFGALVFRLRGEAAGERVGAGEIELLDALLPLVILGAGKCFARAQIARAGLGAPGRRLGSDLHAGGIPPDAVLRGARRDGN